MGALGWNSSPAWPKASACQRFVAVEDLESFICFFGVLAVSPETLGFLPVPNSGLKCVSETGGGGSWNGLGVCFYERIS